MMNATHVHAEAPCVAPHDVQLRLHRSRSRSHLRISSNRLITGTTAAVAAVTATITSTVAALLPAAGGCRASNAHKRLIP